MIDLTPDRKTLSSWVIEKMEAQDDLITPGDLVKSLKSRLDCTRKEAKQILYDLVSNGDLEYIDAFGRTMVIPSFSGPVHVSSHIVLTPPDVHYFPKKNEIAITLGKGIAFGRGNHPTTTMCLQALTYLYRDCDDERSKATRVLDVGTGTGVLAIAAAKLGAETVYGCDIDPVSVQEARNNVCLNQLENTVVIGEAMQDGKQADLILANLRAPTLIDLQKIFDAILSDTGLLVLSGLMKSEEEKILNVYQDCGLKKIWGTTKKKWCALILERR